MPITSITTTFPGDVGVFPRLIRITTTDSSSAIIVANYLQEIESQGYQFYSGDLVAVGFVNGQPFSSSWYTIVKTATTITLRPIIATGNITLPTVTGDFAIWANTTGFLKDSGFSPTDATKAKVVMANGAFTVNNLIKAGDTAGTTIDAGARILSGVTNSWGGGGTQNAYSVPGLSVQAVGTATIHLSTNAVSITSIQTSTNTLTVNFSADPGANTAVFYMFTTNIQG